MDSKTIDTNVSLSRWPFRRLPLDEPEKLVAKLRDSGIVRAWAGSFDAMLHRDIGASNHRLADDCLNFGKDLLVPVGSVNPTNPDWERDLQDCVGLHSTRIIRLHPNYHQYDLRDPRCTELLQAATDLNMLVQIVASMEDTRTQNPVCHVAIVDLSSLAKIITGLPKLRVMVLNGFHGGKPAVFSELAASGRCWFDIATLEGVEGVAGAIATTNPDCLVFGSHAPFFYLESAQLKLLESGLEESVLSRLRYKNAEKAVVAI
jgi:uncharacterized protein